MHFHKQPLQYDYAIDMQYVFADTNQQYNP